MKEIALKVKNSEYDFIMNLLNKFDFVEINSSEMFSDEEKLILNERSNDLKSGKVKGLKWNEIEKILT